MDTKIKRILLSLFAVIIVCFTFFAGFFVGRSALDDDVETLNYIIKMYKKHYYEETDDIVGVIEDALLDIYSDYYTKEEYDIIKATSMGSREGIGISYNVNNFEITQVLRNSPASNACVKEGSIITHVGDNVDSLITADGKNVSDYLDNLPAYKDFILRVNYKGEIKDFTLSKQQYTQTFVSYYDNTGEYGFITKSGQMAFERIGENTTYDLSTTTQTAVIKYTGFSGLGKGIEGSSGQFSTAMQKFAQSNMQYLILDLRDNGGGYMSILEEVSAHLIDAEKDSKNLISYARYKDDKRDNFYSAKCKYSDYNYKKIVVLANENSASASEALMGAMLDYDSNKIVNIILEGSILNGETVYKSYGKGIMQSTYERVTGEAIKLTTAKIFWPRSNISIHDVGLTPSLDPRILAESSYGAVYDAVSLCK